MTLRDDVLARLGELIAGCRAATSGPREVGDPYGIAGILGADGRCTYCHSSEPIWIGPRDINGAVMEAHVHRFREPHGTDLVHYDRVGGVVSVTSPNDWGPGVEETDARHIAAHSPDRMLALYEGLRAEVERHRLRETDKRAWYCAGCAGMPTYRTGDEACPGMSRFAAMLGLDAGTPAQGGGGNG